MSSFSRRVPLMVLCALGIQCGSSTPPEAQPPSVIVITVDTLRADRLGCYGYFRNTSPTIDTLAQDGILFERAYAPMSTTLPSHISLMTSMNPLQHGVLGNFMHLKTALSTSDELHTAAQLFERQGYATAAFISCTPLKSHSGMDAGFEVYDEPDGALRVARETTDAALAWIEDNAERPVFLWLHYFDPHQPYGPPADFEGGFTRNRKLRSYLAERGVELSERVTANNNLYDSSILYLDSQLQRLLDELKSNGLYQDSTVVFTADHGEGLGQHGWMDHGPIYEEDIHVPLIIKLPGVQVQGGQRRTDLAALIDVLPTLTGISGLSLSDLEQAQFTGHHLLSDESPRQHVFSQRVARGRRWGAGLKYALTGLRWKYYHLTEGDDELYDLEQDPAELQDVLAEQTEVAREMKAILLKKIRTYERQSREAGDDTQFSQQVLDDLKALGYAP